jgi:hypothetical protein
VSNTLLGHRPSILQAQKELRLLKRYGLVGITEECQHLRRIPVGMGEKCQFVYS